jgi:hypothetical protein
VLTAIYFDNNLSAEGHKVDDVVADRCLLAEVETECFQVTQLDPKLYFLRREVLAKRASFIVWQKASPRKAQTPTRPAFGRPPSPQGGGIRHLLR